jgi:hypothetical protein
MSRSVLHLDPQLVKFPDRCTECGATATRTSRRSGRGRDHLVFHVPICDRCDARTAKLRVAWVLGSIATAIGLVIVIATGADAAVRAMPGLRPFAGGIAMLLFVCAGAFVWWANRAGARAFHRRFSAVWIEGYAKNRVALAVRRPELEADIAVLSGTRGVTSNGDPYRGHAPVAPPAHDGKARVRPAMWIIWLVGIGMMIGGVAEYFSLATAEEKRDVIRGHWLEIVLYRIGGKGLVGGVLVGVGVLLFVSGVVLARRAKVRPAS